MEEAFPFLKIPELVATVWRLIPVQELSHFWGSRRGGGEIPVERSGF
jgi:hypothetical protein